MIETIGFIGLGKMGLPMSKNLVSSDVQVFGTDVNESALAEFQRHGGKTGELESWIHNVQAIILMLPSSTVVNKVIDDIINLYDPTSRNHSEPLLIIDMSSSYPTETRNNEARLQQNNIQLVDAPVSGGVKKAVSASLTIMFGGTEDQFENCKRLLRFIGTDLHYVGPIGSGHLIKAINNYLSATHLLASSEAIQLLESFNVNPETAINVINHSSGRNGSTEYKFPSFILNEAYNSGFSLDLMKKDITMASQLFEEANAGTVLPKLVVEKFKEASNELQQGADHTEIYRYVSTYLLKRGISNETN
jgi:3-hydroxyisobutyrate dehydrogenase-like beta-hydroxyacid dehydrogenase